MVKLFEMENGALIPTIHCSTLKALKDIQDKYENYMPVYLYLYYITCPDPENNPFFDTPDSDKEELILSQLGDIEFSLEDDEIIDARAFLEHLYETPTLRAYIGVKGALDNVAVYLKDTAITDGRDGNIMSVINTAAKFNQIRESFKGTLKDLLEEQKSTFRGGSDIAYDQK